MTMTEATKQAPRTVDQQVARLLEYIGGVESEIDALESRLSSVLGEEPPRPETSPLAEPECGCPLAYELDGLARSVASLGRRLEGLRERVGL